MQFAVMWVMRCNSHEAEQMRFGWGGRDADHQAIEMQLILPEAAECRSTAEMWIGASAGERDAAGRAVAVRRKNTLRCDRRGHFVMPIGDDECLVITIQAGNAYRRGRHPPPVPRAHQPRDRTMHHSHTTPSLRMTLNVSSGVPHSNESVQTRVVKWLDCRSRPNVWTEQFDMPPQVQNDLFSGEKDDRRSSNR
jgi:hypothetical protein